MILVKYEVKKLYIEGRCCQKEKMVMKKCELGTSPCFQPSEEANPVNTVTLVFWYPE